MRNSRTLSRCPRLYGNVVGCREVSLSIYWLLQSINLILIFAQTKFSGTAQACIYIPAKFPLIFQYQFLFSNLDCFFCLSLFLFLAASITDEISKRGPTSAKLCVIYSPLWRKDAILILPYLARPSLVSSSRRFAFLNCFRCTIWWHSLKILFPYLRYKYFSYKIFSVFLPRSTEFLAILSSLNLDSICEFSSRNPLDIW